MVCDFVTITRDQTTPSDYVTPIVESHALDFSKLRPWAAVDRSGVVSSHPRQAPLSVVVIGSFHIVVDQTDDGGAHLVTPNLHALVGLARPIGAQPVNRPSPGNEIAKLPDEQAYATAKQLSPSVAALQWIEEATGLPKTRIHRLFGVSRESVYNWLGGAHVTEAHRQRLLAVYEVLQRAQLQYKTPALMAAWLDTPTGAEGVTPAQLLEQGKIDRARTLAMVTPSPGLAPVPHWVRRRSPEAWKAGAESRQEAFPPNDAEASPPGNRGE